MTTSKEEAILKECRVILQCQHLLLKLLLFLQEEKRRQYDLISVQCEMQYCLIPPAIIRWRWQQ